MYYLEQNSLTNIKVTFFRLPTFELKDGSVHPPPHSRTSPPDADVVENGTSYFS